MSMYDIIQEAIAKASHFGGGNGAAAPAAAPAHAGPSYGPTGGASSRVLSPTAHTVLDERETYLANKAGYDAKWEGNSLLARAMARARGEAVPDMPIHAEPGAPTSSRPLASPESVIAAAMATAQRPPSGPAPGPEKPYSGLDPVEEYNSRKAASDGKYGAGSPYARAMARARGQAVPEMPIHPEPGAPSSTRPLRGPEAVIAEAMATAPKPSSTPAPGPAKPYSGLSPQEEYEMRTKASAEKQKSGGLSFYEQAMARYNANKKK